MDAFAWKLKGSVVRTLVRWTTLGAGFQRIILVGILSNFVWGVESILVIQSKFSNVSEIKSWFEMALLFGQKCFPTLNKSRLEEKV